MAIYSIKNRWGGPTAEWKDGYNWVMGCRTEQLLVAIDITSDDNGETFSGTMTWSGEGSITVEMTQIVGNNYSVQSRWGGSNQPLHNGGNWIIGSRTDQRVTSLNVTSDDNGQTLSGTMVYDGEGPISVNATVISGSGYTVENRWGGEWHLRGTMVLGTRETKKPVAIDITSADNGASFTGQMTYSGEGPISFKAQLEEGNNYKVQNRWGGEGAPWHDGGIMTIGCNDGKYCVALNVSSDDEGETLTGTMQYENEGEISFYGAISSCVINIKS